MNQVTFALSEVPHTPRRTQEAPRDAVRKARGRCEVRAYCAARGSIDSRRASAWTARRLVKRSRRGMTIPWASLSTEALEACGVAAVLERATPRVRSALVRFLCVVVGCRGDGGRDLFGSQDWIGELVGIRPRTFRMWIRRLMESGVLLVDATFYDHGPGRSRQFSQNANLYAPGLLLLMAARASSVEFTTRGESEAAPSPWTSKPVRLCGAAPTNSRTEEPLASVEHGIGEDRQPVPGSSVRRCASMELDVATPNGTASRASSVVNAPVGVGTSSSIDAHRRTELPDQADEGETPTTDPHELARLWLRRLKDSARVRR